jgi:hypothetical protein
VSRPDALPGFLEVVHRFVKDGFFVSHAREVYVRWRVTLLYASL